MQAEDISLFPEEPHGIKLRPCIVCCLYIMTNSLLLIVNYSLLLIVSIVISTMIAKSLVIS